MWESAGAFSPFAEVIKFEEGFMEKPYTDHLGNTTIGHGIHSITEEESEAVVALRLAALEETLAQEFGHLQWALMSDARQAAFLSMAYQLGVTGFKRFKKMISAVRAGDFDKAAEECLDSLAAKQTPERFARNYMAIKTGESQWSQLS